MGVDRSAKSAQDHALEVKQAFSDATPTSQYNSSPSLLQARHLLLPPSSPPSPTHTSDYVSLFPPNWTLLTITLTPKPHHTSPSHILVSKVTATPTATKTRQRGRPSRKKKATAKQTESSHIAVYFERLDADPLESVIEELDAILDEEKKCQSLRVRKEWWAAKMRLDERLEECLSSMQEALFCGRSELGEFAGPVLLVLGQHLHQLPWESVLSLQDTVVARTPSLTFAAAHRTMVWDM